MNADYPDRREPPSQKGGLAQREVRICATCGTKFSATGDSEWCPVCILIGSVSEESASEEAHTPVSRSEPDSVETGPSSIVRRFENYELMSDESGNPIELGKGAMGVTYKAFDVDLRFPVALKLISEKYVGDESARLRFLREARAAASLRHPNVASVLHLGRTGSSYFYAMEFIEGETLENLLKRSGRLEMKLALEIVTQVAAGLAAVDKQKLVHRDIKPSNIMVSLGEGSTVTAKIIDLGLAKAVSEEGVHSAISTLGAFVGTPDFASPEQFAGIGVNIRSDLYSLGVMLWEMLTGQVPFRGSPAEVMYQHQHTPLPLGQLAALPQPVLALLEVLLEKDPGRRFQNPAELLKAIPPIIAAIDNRRGISRESLQKMPPAAQRAGTVRPSLTLGPEKISVARLPVTGSNVFGREEDSALLDAAWANQDVNIVTIVAWGGVGKSTLINHWLRRMAVEHYRDAELVFGWSFYRQGSSRGSSSADEFIDAALTWFGDPDPRTGTAWEKGERLAKLMSHRRTLLVLDGLEPLQNPPGPEEGRVRGPALQALLRELAAFNPGLCVMTTRIPVSDIADHERTSVLRLDLEQLSSDDGAKLLRALGIKGQEAELRIASDEFNGHCLALTLMGSYLADAYDGDIRCREEVSKRLAHDVRQGGHAQRVMESYQTWFGEGPELSILRMLGLFDRPADEKAIRALLEPPAIPGLTESLAGLSPSEWRTMLSRLRRAKLLAGKDPHNPGEVDAHPLVREYFGEQLRNQRAAAWKESNRRLFAHYQRLAPHLPESFGEMEPLFLAVVCGCNAGLFRAALHEVYLPRIQRGSASFAANVLSARGALLSVLAHFFEDGYLGSTFETSIDGQSLTAEDQLFILMQAAQYLPATRGLGSPELRICYERAESLCQSLHHPRLLCLAVRGLWRYSIITAKPIVALPIAERVYSLAQRQDDPMLVIGALDSLASTLFHLCDFESSRKYAMRGVQIWRLGGVQFHPEDFDTPVVGCLCYEAMSEWHLGEISACQATMDQAISLATELNDANALVFALQFAAVLAHLERNRAETERLALEMIELSTRYNLVIYLHVGAILRGWVRCASGNPVEGISWIERGIREYRASGSIVGLSYFLVVKAEALHLADRTSEALEAIVEAEATVERSGVRTSRPELHRLRGVFLAAMGADEAQIEASFRESIRIAREQKAISIEKRAKANFAEYCRQKTSVPEGRGFRLPVW